MLTFDAPSHTYRWFGEIRPSVTQCLEKLHSFAGIDKAILEAAQTRGTYVHDLTVAHDLDDLVVDKVPENYLPYLQAWQRFIADYAPNWTGIERMRYSVRHGFAGTEDRRGTLGKVYPGARFGLDIKTGAQSHPVWGLQLAAYRQLASEEEMRCAIDRRATVQLHPDATYTFTEWTSPQDWNIFRSLLDLIQWGVDK